MSEIDAIAARWCGRFHNHRQVAANLVRGGPIAPELSREHRELQVHRLHAPQLGDVVLYLQEFRATLPDLAHRQRVTVLRRDPETECVRGEQLFFREGPAYDRSPLAADVVAQLPMEAFVRYPGCDLFFRQEPNLDRWRGAMRPGACVYPHPMDGQVCADFEMLLHPDQLWYRDRSVRLADGTVRGEVDGFSWLLFDRFDSAAPLPALLEHQGVWRGTFRRFDGEGELCETFASTIVIRAYEEAGEWRYHQSNLHHLGGAQERRIEAHGTVRDGRVWFVGSTYDGWAMDLPQDVPSHGALIVMRGRDGTAPDVEEIVSLSDDGRRRSRTAHFLRAGNLVGRTFIDEERISDDWRSWDADAAP